MLPAIRPLAPGRHQPLRSIAAIGLVLAVSAALVPFLPRVFGRAAAATLGVSVSGNHLVDASGATLTLHGVNESGTEFACDQSGTPTSRGWSIYGGQPLAQAATYAAVAAWHANAVRVPLNEDCWLGINGVNPAYGGATYIAAIQAEVAAIHQSGLVAILDLHWTAPGAWAAVAQNPVPDQDHSPAFWSSVATTFKADPAVVFDLFNEPFIYGSYTTADPWTCWLDGCQFTQFVSGGQVGPAGQATGYTTAYVWQSAGMQELVNDVRAAGATQPVLVNGLDWSNDDSGWLAHAPTDPAHQLVVGAHIYPGELCDTTACWDGVYPALSGAYPVIVGETGDHATTAVSSFFATFLGYADAHGWSYLAWTWNPWANPDDVLITDWAGTPNVGEGAAYKQHLAAFPPPIPLPLPTSTSTPTPAASATPAPSGSGSGSTARIRGGINAEPSMRPWRYVGANPDSWWCAVPNCYQNADPSVTINRELTLIHGLGAANVRLEFPWYLLEPQRGSFDWTRADMIFAAAATHGVQIQPILVFTPAWAGSNTTVAPAAADFSAFVTAFVHRYDAQLSVVEMWNEPDDGHYWNSGEAAYISSILSPGYAAVKAVDPRVQVEMGAPVNDSGSCCTWLDGLLNAGAPFDIAAYHNYVGTAISEAGTYQQHLAAHGRGTTPIWLGEYGVQENSLSDTNQQSLFTSVLTSSAPLAMAQWYNLRDDNAMNCCPMAVAVSAYWGLVQHDDVTLKQGYSVMQSLLTGQSAGTSTASPTPAPVSGPVGPVASPTPTATPSPTVDPTQGSAPSGTLVYSDNFDGDAAGSTPAGWSAGTGWSVSQEHGSHDYRHSGSSGSTVASVAMPNDFDVAMDVALSAWGSESVELQLRRTDGVGHYSVRFSGGSTVAFGKVADGNWTTLASSNVNYGNKWQHLDVRASGSTFSVTLNGSSLFSVSDSSFGSGGMALWANDPFAFDNLAVRSL
jgi:hypothetical protein